MRRVICLLFCLTTPLWAKESLPIIDENIFKAPGTILYKDVLGEMATLIEQQKIKLVINDNESELFRNLISMAYLDILKTPTGQKFCSAIILSGKKLSYDSDTSFFYFTNAKREFREKFKLACQKAPLNESTHFKMPIDAFNRLMPKNARTHTLFLLRDDTPIQPLDSWSLKNNHIAIFSLEKDFNYLHLIKILIHELSITFDSKNRGMTEYMRKVNLLEQNDEEKLCEIGYVIENPLISKTLSAIRAFAMEDKILLELQNKYDLTEKLVHSNFSFTNERQCQKAVTDQFLDNIDDLLEFIIDKNSLYFLSPHLLTGCKLLPNQNSNFLLLFETLFTSTLKIDDKNISSCEFFTTPEIKSLYSLFSDGPRPRPKGGWKISPLKIDEKNNDTKITMKDLILKLQDKSNMLRLDPKNTLFIDLDQLIEKEQK